MAKPAPSQNPRKNGRPDIFRYHDFRLFLQDWVAYLKARDSEFSIRSLAESAQVATSYISMVLKGSRRLSLNALAKLMPHLQLNPSEQTHLENLVKLATVETREAKVIVLGRMSRSSPYQKRNPKEAAFFEFMSHWYNLAIREMARLPGFRYDPEWIQSQLKPRPALQAVKDALKFLTKNGFLKKNPDGTVVSGEDTLQCEGPVYWSALIECYKQMYYLAMDSIETTPPEQRNLQGFTVTMNSRRFEKAQKILNRALNEIEALEKSDDGPNDRVYQVELALFPLTQDTGAGNDGEEEK